MGAFYSAIVEWFKLPKIGGMASKGFGTFLATVGDNLVVVDDSGIQICDDVKSLISSYNDFIKSEGCEFIDILGSGKSAKK